MVVFAFSPALRRWADLWVQGHPGQDSQDSSRPIPGQPGIIEKPCLKEKRGGGWKERWVMGWLTVLTALVVSLRVWITYIMKII